MSAMLKTSRKCEINLTALLSKSPQAKLQILTFVGGTKSTSSSTHGREAPEARLVETHPQDLQASRARRTIQTPEETGSGGNQDGASDDGSHREGQFCVWLI